MLGWMLRELFPNKKLWKADGSCRFVFGQSWKEAFLGRWNYALRKTTSGKKQRQDLATLHETMLKFHMDVRLFQVPEANDPWGVFNRDQVPLQCTSSMATTVNERGASFIWNVMWNPDEKYRFATMNLTVPMKVIWAVDDSLPDAGWATYPLFILCLRAQSKVLCRLFLVWYSTKTQKQKHTPINLINVH